MTTPADSQSPYPFSPRLRTEDEPTLGISDYDALADLFLGDEPDEPELSSFGQAASEPRTITPIQRADTSESTTVEALLVGHLPVRAQFWVTQHARSVADKSCCTVAVLRLMGGEVSLDLLAPTDTKRSFSTIDARSVDEALALAARAAQHWIVVVDELAESDLIADADLDRITLLTSADRPAVLNAYQLIKRTVSAIGATNSPDLGVEIMGSSPEDATRAAAQINHACATFLSCPVEVTIGSERIDATRAVPIYRGRSGGDSSATELIRRATRLAGSERSDSEGQTQRAERTVKAQREPGLADGSCAVLARYIEGLKPLSLTCPIEPRAQLAIDEESRIHILATGDGPDPVRSLTQAGAWASLNRQLILAAAQRANDSDSEPVLHLLVDDVPTNRRLLDAPIRVHLLRSIPVRNAEPVWFSAPLN